MPRKTSPEGKDRLETSKEIEPGANGDETTVWDAMIRNNHVGAAARRHPR